MKLYGHKCHICTHLDGPTHKVEATWPVADDECPDCAFCQEAAFTGALLRAYGGAYLFDPETRAAVKALMAGKPHPVIDKLRRELRREGLREMIARSDYSNDLKYAPSEHSDGSIAP